MNLRKLEQKDAPLMLEWMHDDSVVHYMGTDFAKKTIEDCRAFIAASQTDLPHVHRAIVGDDDVYMGTVSLKNVNTERKDAEFAITIRKAAMGKGYSKFGMSEIIRIGFEEFALETIYWYVSKENHRAIRFYEKNGYKEADYMGGGYRKNRNTNGLLHSDQTCFAAERSKTEYRGCNPSFCREQGNCLTA